MRGTTLGGGCNGCPKGYGYEDNSPNCTIRTCKECWDREIPVSEALNCSETPNSSEAPSSSDLISRQEAIDALKGLPTWWADEGGYYGGAQLPMVALLHPEDAVSAIENLPSALPERKTGHWILTSDDDYEYCTCSECGYQNGENWMIGSYIKFCQECGTKMVEPRESEDKE